MCWPALWLCGGPCTQYVAIGCWLLVAGRCGLEKRLVYVYVYVYVYVNAYHASVEYE